MVVQAMPTPPLSSVSAVNELRRYSAPTSYVPNGGDRSRGALSDRLTVAEELVICSIAWASS